MEISSDARNNGGMKLPIGFRFHPTDEELVVHYLKRKVCSLPLPASVIPEFDVYLTNPWDLPAGDSTEKMYFFSRRRGNVNQCSSFTAGSGYWKKIGKETHIVIPGTYQAVGIKKSLVFFEGKRPRGITTRWIMQEYRIVGNLITPESNQKLMMEMGDWVVCRIYQKKIRAKNHGKMKRLQNSHTGGTDRVIKASIIKDFMMKDSTDLDPRQLSASCSSGVTEVASEQLDDEASSVVTFDLNRNPVF